MGYNDPLTTNPARGAQHDKTGSGGPGPSGGCSVPLRGLVGPLLPRPAALPPLARYAFNGNGKDETKNNPDFELKNTSFKDNALYLNGVYQWDQGKAIGYRAVCRTPNSITGVHRGPSLPGGRV